MPDLYETAKTVSSLEAFERYIGGQLRKKGKYTMCRCPWHPDKTPSLAFFEDGMFKCFGCGATGTSIDVARRAFHLDRKEAAMRVCLDFGMKYDNSAVPTQKQIASRSRKTHTEELTQFNIEVCEYLHALDKYLDAKEAEERDADAFSESFIRAVNQRNSIEALADRLVEIFEKDDIDAGVALMNAYKDQRKKWKKISPLWAAKEMDV